MGPELLIADEAVSALDVSVQAQVLALLEEIREQLDLAMLFITHDLRVAAQICHQVAVMSRGEIVSTAKRQTCSKTHSTTTQSAFEAAPGVTLGLQGPDRFFPSQESQSLVRLGDAERNQASWHDRLVLLSRPSTQPYFVMGCSQTCGSRPMPTPGGVPVVMMSPG